ncbi:MAG: hypothetical protein J1E80_04685 [Desulfovibrionaceae bacterium]|nr:hypothetical protein [Desulfovibrionaceae bacterium]
MQQDMKVFSLSVLDRVSIDVVMLLGKFPKQCAGIFLKIFLMPKVFSLETPSLWSTKIFFVILRFS